MPRRKKNTALPENITIQELPPSALGTHVYWTQNYIKDIENYQSRGSVGEIWFEEGSQTRIINWMEKHLDKVMGFATKEKKDEAEGTDAESPRKNLHIADVGCGNGMFLIELGRLGYKRLHGIDYSPEAIFLASSIARDQDLLYITYRVLNLTDNEHIESVISEKYDIVHDKGTYDAISLNPDNPRLKRLAYCKSIEHLVAPKGLFIITSCNWSEDEIRVTFKDAFDFLATIPTPTFNFGGKVGNLVTSAVFRKKEAEEKPPE